MAYYSKYTGAELEERLDKVEEIPQLIAQMITGKDFVTKEDLLCVLRDYAPATYATIPIDKNTIYWENGVLKAATSDGGGQCQWELREHKGIQYLFSRLPVVTQYDVTMYADVNHLDLPNIYDGLPIDGDTIYWEETENGRILKSKYEGSSGVDASEVLSIVSSAGYATQNWVNNQNFINSSFLYTELAKYVKIKDYQEIEGVKNFLNGLQIAGLPITKLNGYEDVIYIDANVVVRGGVTMYYQDGEVDLPSIIDEIGIAGYDGKKLGLVSFSSSQFSIDANGNVTIKGGSTGLDTAQLAEYLTTNKYATQGWITEQNYASASNLTALQSKVDNFLEGSDSDTIINKWLELEAFLSGLSESDNLATILSNKANKSTTLAGYGITDAYTKTQVDNTFKLYIPIAGYTEITGEKNFTGGLRVNNSPVIYYDEDNKYWKLEGDLLVTGGVSMYSDDTSYIPSTIMDAVVVDGVTIKKRSEDGALYFAGTMDGGVTDFWELNNIPTWIGSSKPTYTLGSLQNVDSSSIDATATVDRVLFQQAGSATWITKPLSEIGSGSGSVSGDYLPLSNTSTPIVLNTQPRVVNFKSSNAYEVGIGLIRGNTDKGSLYASNSSIGIHNKVKDTAFYLKDDGGLKYEINGVEHDVLNGGNYSSYALPLSGGTIKGSVLFEKYLILTALGNGTYNIGLIGVEDDEGFNLEAPLDGDSRESSRMPIHLTWRGGYVNKGGLRITNSDEAYLGGNKILHAGNYSSYALPLSGGQMSGHIYMTGAKADSSIGNTTQIVFGTPSDNHACITSNRYGIIINRSLSDTSNQIVLYADADSESLIQSHLRIYGNLFSNIYFSHGGSSVRQSDASMYTWDNHLQINKRAGMTYVKTLLNFDLVNETATFNLDSQLRFNSNMYWVSDSTNPYMALVQGGHNWYVQISQGYMYLGAGATYSLRIDASGNILAPGGITMYSDQRKKTILNHVELSLKQIADAPLIEHYYNSDQNKTTHVGSIAQYWAGLNDWFCKLDNEGYYTMEIQNCALASAISIARHLEKYESKTDKKIRMLKKRITELEDKLEKLEGGNYGCN